MLHPSFRNWLVPFKSSIVERNTTLTGMIIILMCSCSSMEKLPIQVPIRFQDLSPEIQSLAILNRSMTDNFTNHKSVPFKTLARNRYYLDTVISDSVAADSAIQAAAATLFRSGRFNVVIPRERNLARTDKLALPLPLDSGFINQVCKDFNVNGVLVLESFKEKVSSGMYSKGIYEPNRSYYVSSIVLNISYELIWRLYQPDHHPPVIYFKTEDKLTWNSFWHEERNSLYEYVEKNFPPSLKEALIQGGIVAGQEMAGNISPGWVDEFRYYHRTGKSEIDAAIPLIKENKWQEAADIWQKYANVSSKKLRSKVLFNLAFAAEMNDDLHSAIEWANASYQIKRSHKTKIYIKYLRRKLYDKT